MSLNKVMLVGRLGADVVLKFTQDGQPVASFSIATDESYNDQNGNKVQKTEWHKIVCYKKLAENCANYLHKGSLAYIEGKLTTRKWQDQQGQNRYTTEIVASKVLFLSEYRNDNKEPEIDGNSDNSEVPF